jgi:hypothetical protein
MQVHQHLVKAIPNSWYLEVIPSLVDELFEHPVQLKQGVCISPLEPGASTAFADKAFRKYRVA